MFKKMSHQKLMVVALIFSACCILALGCIAAVTVNAMTSKNSKGESEKLASLQSNYDNSLTEVSVTAPDTETPKVATNNNTVASSSWVCSVTSADLTDSETIISAESESRITKAEAITLAFNKAKKFQKEYGVVIDDNAASNARCELNSKSGAVFYRIYFENIPLESLYIPMTTTISVDIDADTGAVLAVHQYK